MKFNTTFMDKEKTTKEEINKEFQTKTQETVVNETAKTETEKLLFSWTAPARPFKRRDRDFWITIIVITAITGLVLFFAEGFMPVILIISVIFLYYILSTVEPENIDYKLTTGGLKMADKLNPWDKLGRFWFTKRFNDQLLVFEAFTMGGRLEVVIKPNDKEKIKSVLSKYLLHEEAPPSTIDKATNWFSKKLPGMS